MSLFVEEDVFEREEEREEIREENVINNNVNDGVSDDVNNVHIVDVDGVDNVNDVNAHDVNDNVHDNDHDPNLIHVPEDQLHLPLKYQQEIVNDILLKDSLLILGRGLGWELIVANILYILNLSNIKERLPNPPKNKKSLLIVLNCNDVENHKLNRELGELSMRMKTIGGESILADKRKRIYNDGGVVSVTSRILVVDLLSGIITPEEINGLFILHGERIRETSNESFIVNLYRDSNEWGFIKAFSDDPESFTGFTPLASRLKNLRLSNVILWPRFHVDVSSSLSFRNRRFSKDIKAVYEINIRLSYKMNKIQSAILYCIEACLNELKRHNPTLATDYWDMENIHDDEFIQRIRLNLDSQWHRISKTSKQLIFDISTLKDLLRSLLVSNSLTFYQHVQGVIDSNVKSSSNSTGTMNMSSMSPWLSLDEATTITSYSRDRALGTTKVKVDDESSLVYNLEELPKWVELNNLMNEIPTDSRILIMATTRSTVEQLRLLVSNYLNFGNVQGRNYMISRLQDYIIWKEISNWKRHFNEEMNEEKSEEQLEEQLSTSKTFTRGRDNISKRRRTRGASSVANVGRLYSGTNQDRNPQAVTLDDDILERLYQEQESLGVKKESEQVIEGFEVGNEGSEVGNERAEVGNEIKKEPHDNILPQEDDIIVTGEKHRHILIRAYDDQVDSSLLNEFKPTHIVMYEPNLSFIRRIEYYQAVNVQSPAKVYFMYYGNSVEEQRHLLNIKKEKEAFTKLIREKANLSKTFETKEDSKFKITKNNVVNTRIAGGMKFQTEDDEFRIIVDVREFRSPLPNLLYRVGAKVIPCMLTIGDYVLTPKICIERKAIPDLISSFKSGRLFNQCEQMFRHYEIPVLLIEFDESKSFSFDPFQESKRPNTNFQKGLVQHDIQSKLVMLLVSFPKLKIVWSSSPYETAQIFLELKSGQDPPNVSEAINKGLHINELPSLINEDAIDLIQTIPGITNLNYFKVINSVRDINELVHLTKPAFIELIGEENGNKAYNFINQSIKGKSQP